ncbi:MAG: glucose-1-phosphate cytidylyltransferase [Nitrospinae bacterium CG11_big_fil_rev_8_21_14_0_20_56_8]|nr:MAG: glucose-1-phosphate cytidylyltransferase [Nitrospinae bacterium CG11_big_fil_rev_8_21_14_0_20_56_8]
MKVVILCGGMGTRLREETEFRPKPMVKIGSRPILWHIMKMYAHYGHNDFVLCLGYKGETIKEYFYHYMLHNNDVTIELGKERSILFHANSEEENWRVTLVDTGEHTLKGGRIKRIQKYLPDETFMVTYGDGVANIDVPGLLEYHGKHGKIATVTGVHPRSSYGQLKTSNGKVVHFIEKPKMEESMINGGFFVFNKKIFNYLSPDEDCDFEIGALETLTQEGQFTVYPHKGDWACMDTYRDMAYLNRLWNEGKAFWKVWP